MTKHSPLPACVVNSADQQYLAKQGYLYHSGISAETAGAKGICMHLLTIPPGGREKAHLHRDQETAIYVISGRAKMLYGDALTERLTVKAGDFLYVPPNVPHLPYNPSQDESCTVVISRTDASEQEGVALLHEFDKLYSEGAGE